MTLAPKHMDITSLMGLHCILPNGASGW